MKELLKKTSVEEFRSQGERAASLLRSSPVWSACPAIFVFLSMEKEIDTRPLLESAFEEGKKIFTPKTESSGKLVFYQPETAQGPWVKGPFGIREPVEGKALDMNEAGDFPALIVSPGLAFDREGNRLGRGGGYYDRFFAELDDAGKKYFALGLCMDFQIVEKVPAGENDKKMDGILTQGNNLEIRRFSGYF